MAAVGGRNGQDGELRALLRLRLVPGLGERGMKLLLEKYGSARQVARRSGELPRPFARALHSRSVAAEAEAQLDAMRAAGAKPRLVTGAGYPAPLRELADPPALLFIEGRSELLDAPTVAIVGTRKPGRDGLVMAERLAAAVASAGGVVVSGLALGIDGVAHRAALPRTIAVLGCGTDVFYPRHHRRLQRRIAEEALLISEFLPGTGVLPHHFPQRNRIIAGLSDVVVVVEAPARSGALITADHALDLGRDVLAVPGSACLASCAGSNALLRDGARPVVDASDVLHALEEVGRAASYAGAESRGSRGLGGRPGVGGALGESGARRESDDAAPALLAALAAAPMSVDELCAETGATAADAAAGLLELELRGLVRRLPGQQYGRI